MVAKSCVENGGTHPMIFLGFQYVSIIYVMVVQDFLSIHRLSNFQRVYPIPSESEAKRSCAESPKRALGRPISLRDFVAGIFDGLTIDDVLGLTHRDFHGSMDAL